jgi:hypothetical protein
MKFEPTEAHDRFHTFVACRYDVAAERTISNMIDVEFRHCSIQRVVLDHVTRPFDEHLLNVDASWHHLCFFVVDSRIDELDTFRVHFL